MVDEVSVVKKQLLEMFTELNGRMDAINLERHREGAMHISKAEVRLLGQMSLLANERVSLFLSLTQTVDMDALLKMDSMVKKEMESILKKKRFGL